jgi:hypothetical protein
LDVELIHKLEQDNVVSNALSRKEEFQVEKPLTKIQTLRAIHYYILCPFAKGQTKKSEGFAKEKQIT